LELQKIYRHRFNAADLPFRVELWKTLCQHFFSRYVRPTDTVVDVGAGYCEFINHIPGRRKIAIDLNPDVRRFAAPGVEVINEPCTNLTSLPAASANVVFMSNFLEHLPTKDMVIDTLAEAKRILVSGGRLMILQPNIRFVGHEYWDFIDHHTPLTDRSLVEALENLGMDIELLIPRFLPYTTKSAMPKATFLVRLYLMVPIAWHVLGKQAFVIALKRS
jgi:SAM-dependent methyltransferase